MKVFRENYNIDWTTRQLRHQFADVSINTDESYYRELKQVLKIKRVKDFPFVRVGKNFDGGYIMVDNLAGKVAYSFGISNDVSWDAFMVNHGYDIFMYDPTIEGLPVQHEKFHFFREGIAGKTDLENSMDTLENFIKRNGHENQDNMILKMDVEGAEWDFLENVSLELLNKFDQMVFEFHNITDEKSISEMGRTVKLIDKINSTHTLVHLHGNNCGHFIEIDRLGVFPVSLELTYLKTANYNFVEDENIFLPIALDQPNDPSLKDIELGYWNKF